MSRACLGKKIVYDTKTAPEKGSFRTADDHRDGLNRVRIDHREHPALDRPQRGEAASEQDGRPEREGQAGVQQQRRGVEYNAEVQGHAAEEEQRGDGAVRATEAQLEVGVSCDQV